MDNTKFIKLGRKFGYSLGVSEVQDEIIDEETGEKEIITFYYLNFINSFLVLDFALYTGREEESSFTDFYNDVCDKIDITKFTIPSENKVREVIDYYLTVGDPKHKEVLAILNS